jgi:hypothetical protein
LQAATEDYVTLAALGEEHGRVLESIDEATIRWLDLGERA